jgi:hypothetical protein
MAETGQVLPLTVRASRAVINFNKKNMKNFTGLLSFILALFSGHAHAEDPKSQSFVADANVQKIAEAYALDAVDLAKSQFSISLDWSDASIENVKKALVKMQSCV